MLTCALAPYARPSSKSAWMEECDYQVEANHEDKSVTLKGGLQLSETQVRRFLRPAFAMTYYAAQGLSLPGKVRVCDTDSKNFTTRLLLVGCSRACSSQDLQVE